jgi:hypothetical protein
MGTGAGVGVGVGVGFGVGVGLLGGLTSGYLLMYIVASTAIPINKRMMAYPVYTICWDCPG